jgi:ubiquinone/menaquinone biosynthesis C-methylase UbiE
MTESRQPRYPNPGGSTAVPSNIKYRLGKLKAMGLLNGVWLDCGCAEGGYTEALIERGVERAVGIDPDPSRIDIARSRKKSNATSYRCCTTEIPFPDNSFDGVLLNEVLEHVADEDTTLHEIHRVLRPSGRLVVMSPNRWFPFEGHGMRVLGKSFGFPIPFLPWLPSAISMHVMEARNYWPGELAKIITGAGFTIISIGYIMPVFEVYEWLPKSVIRFYRKAVPFIEKTPLRMFGVSTLIIASPRDKFSVDQPSHPIVSQLSKPKVN